MESETEEVMSVIECCVAGQRRGRAGSDEFGATKAIIGKVSFV
ncbi:MAG TPA: hypothetical protein VMD99_01080 [Terriglobales bacterium]|nr:hypothetical protein [Terriglobales bacterium]